jgi:uracil-DNA glycosylase
MSEILKERMGESWYNQLLPYLETLEFEELGKSINQARQSKNVFPEKEHVFRAFKETPFESVRVVFLGMDPYPTKGHAIGISFGINPDRHIPVSLMNIRKEVENDLDVIDLHFDFSMLEWCRQGVLMLNVALTVEEKSPGSHIKLWRPFTEYVFNKLREKHTGIIYILLGKQAQEYKKLIDTNLNYVIEAPHPAAESYTGGKAGFFGSKIFSKTNKILYANTSSTIQWTGSDYSLKSKSRPESDEPDPF